VYGFSFVWDDIATSIFFMALDILYVVLFLFDSDTELKATSTQEAESNIHGAG
jgi:hypothetical protein